MSQSKSQSSTRSVLGMIMRNVRSVFVDDEDLNATEPRLLGLDFYGTPLNTLPLSEPYPDLRQPPPDPRRFPETDTLASQYLSEIEYVYQALGDCITELKSRAEENDWRKEDVKAEIKEREYLRLMLEGWLNGIRSEECQGAVFPIVAAWPVSNVPNGFPTSLLIFLEVLRLAAAPAPNSDNEWLSAGKLYPKSLPRGYFFDSAADKIKSKGGRASGVVRISLLSAYTHILLRVLAARKPEFFNAFAVSDLLPLHERRKKRLAALEDLFAKSGFSSSEAGQFIGQAALEYLASGNFEKLFNSVTSSTVPLAILSEKVSLAGAPRTAEPASDVAENAFPPSSTTTLKHSRKYCLPSTLFALMQISAARTGATGRLFADKDSASQCSNLLNDASRIDRAEKLLDQENMIWAGVSATDGDKDDLPSAKSIQWASLCVALEACLQSEASIQSGEEAISSSYCEEEKMDDFEQGADSSFSRENIEASLRKGKEYLDLKIRKSIAAPSAGKSNQRFAPVAAVPSVQQTVAPLSIDLADKASSIEGDVVFSHIESLAQIRHGGWQAFNCFTRRNEGLAVPRGAIWLPVPSRLCGHELTVVVTRYSLEAGDASARFEYLRFFLVDALSRADGLLHWLEPEDWDDPKMPVGLSDASYSVFGAITRLSPATSAKAHFLCLLACVDDARLQTKFM